MLALLKAKVACTLCGMVKSQFPTTFEALGKAAVVTFIVKTGNLYSSRISNPMKSLFLAILADMV
jgi:hypothetical protein